MRHIVLLGQLLLSDLGALLEVHHVQLDHVPSHEEGSEESLVGARHRDLVEVCPLEGLVLLGEVDDVDGAVQVLGEVVDVEVF